MRLGLEIDCLVIEQEESAGPLRQVVGGSHELPILVCERMQLSDVFDLV